MAEESHENVVKTIKENKNEVEYFVIMLLLKIYRWQKWLADGKRLKPKSILILNISKIKPSRND